MVHYRNYKDFAESLFWNDLENTTFQKNSNCAIKNYQYSTDNFFAVVEKHAPLKKKIVRYMVKGRISKRVFQENIAKTLLPYYRRTVRDKQAPFMNRDFKKEIQTKRR